MQVRHYLSSFVFYDFLGFVAIVSAIAIGVYRAIVMGERRTAEADQLKPALLALGCVAQVFYVLWVGGDFMNGRFLANAVFMAVAVVFVTFHRLPQPRSAMVFLRSSPCR